MRFFLEDKVNIFVYSDESGVLDKAHQKYFVFGGLIFLSKEERDSNARKYLKAERDVKMSVHINSQDEAKASVLTPKYRQKLYRSLNNVIRFGVIIDKAKVLPSIYQSKKDKQRFLDYVYKIAVKRCLQHFADKGIIVPDDVENMYFHIDEHTTATNGKYELRECLEQEFRLGTYNMKYDKFFPPIFPRLQCVNLEYCNSSTVTLVRAADIVANNIYHKAQADPRFSSVDDHLFVIRLP